MFLQLSLAEAVERGGFGQERYEDGAFQERVLQCFYQLMEDKTLNWKVRVTLVPELHPGACAPLRVSVPVSQSVEIRCLVGGLGDSLTGTSPTAAILPGGSFPELTAQQVLVLC